MLACAVLVDVRFAGALFCVCAVHGAKEFVWWGIFGGVLEFDGFVGVRCKKCCCCGVWLVRGAVRANGLP